MFPKLDGIQTITSTLPVKMGRVFLFDFNEKKHVLKDGKPVEATYEQAIQQWITMLVTTELDKYSIYKGTGFGLGIIQFIGRRDIPIGIINSEVKREIEEKAVKHPEISGIENFNSTREGGKIIISFHVVTKQGSIPNEVSVIG